MSLTKQIYDEKKLYDIYEMDYYDRISFMEGFGIIKKSSLNNGEDLDLNMYKKGKNKRVGLDRKSK